MSPIYESRNEPPIAVGGFAVRMLAHIGVSFALIAFSLGIGILGYRVFERMAWIDCFLNAAMLLGGMGPVTTEGLSWAGKLFAGLYALYSGLVFIAVVGILLAPVVHRVLHRFHWEENE